MCMIQLTLLPDLPDLPPTEDLADLLAWIDAGCSIGGSVGSGNKRSRRRSSLSPSNSRRRLAAEDVRSAFAAATRVKARVAIFMMMICFVRGEKKSG